MWSGTGRRDMMRTGRLADPENRTLKPNTEPNIESRQEET